jgi:hypothetical protein
LLVTANVIPNSPILVTLIMQALSSSETSVLTRATRSNIPEDGILHELMSYGYARKKAVEVYGVVTCRGYHTV